MRRLAPLLCALLFVTLVTAPLAHVHAHVTGSHHGQVDVHGGHSHFLTGATDHGHDHHDTDAADHGDTQVVDLQPDMSASAGKLVWVQWIAFASLIVISIVSTTGRGTLLPHPRLRTRPPSPYPHALPLLRGPPLSI